MYHHEKREKTMQAVKKRYNSTHGQTHLHSSPTGTKQNFFTIPFQTHHLTCSQTESFNLSVQIADFSTSVDVLLDPSASAQCPRLGSDRMPHIAGAWVYLQSKVCQRSSSCSAKLLSISHTKLSVSVEARSGTLWGMTQIWV